MRCLTAVLVAACASGAFAQAIPRCIDVGGSFEPPATLDDLLSCQKRARTTYSRKYRALNNAEPSGAAMDRVGDFQQQEVRDYVKLHPGRASGGSTGGEDSAAETLSAGAPPAANGATGTASSDDGSPAGSQPPTDFQGDLGDLQRALNAESDGGKNGVTPQMAEQIVQYISAKQGGVSPDMQELLEAVKRDGVNLKPDTMKKIKRAAREAKANGLDLHVSPDVEKDLLAPDDDAGSAAPQPPPSN